MSGYGDAAPLYWQAGWRSPLPLPPNTKKSPPAGWTGYNGATPSYPDIAAWCEQHAGGNLALRLPDTVIGIDVDHYDDKHGGDTLTHAGQLWGELPPTVRTTSRTDEHSGIRLYRVPASTRLRTVLDFPDQNLGDIEIVQHFHRYAIAWPSIHPNGRQYRWIWPDGRETDQIPAIDDLPELPQPWLDALASLADVIELGGKVDTDAALEHLPQGPPTGRVIDRLTAAIKDLSEGGSRHDTTTRHVLALLRFAEQGDTGVPVALATLRAQFVEALTAGPSARGTRSEAGAEFARMLSNQRGHQLIAASPTIDLDIDGILAHNRPREVVIAAGPAFIDPDDEGDPEPGPDERAAELDEFDGQFWAAREELAAIYAYSHGRYTSPWSVLGAVLCRVLATVPPWITLPPVIGGRGSLNFFCALVGPSGGGKGASAAVAGELVPTDTHQAKLGSGEGLAKTYGKTTKVDGVPTYEQIRNAAVFSVDEVDTVAGLGSRSGATLMPQLRSVFSGETLGFGYADATKAVIVPGHTYRATLYVGVQPGRAGALLDEADGGTPQRFIWLPTTDPRIGTIELDVDQLPQPLDVELSWGPYRRDMEIPEIVISTIRQAHIARQRGEGDALDGHALFAREKVAAGLAVLNGRDYMNEADWELSVIVMDMSDRTRKAVEAELRASAEREAQNKGREMGNVFDAREGHIEDRKRARVEAATLRALAKAGEGGLTFNGIRHTLASRDRDMLGDIVEALKTMGRVVYRDSESSERGGRYVIETAVTK